MHMHMSHVHAHAHAHAHVRAQVKSLKIASLEEQMRQASLAQEFETCIRLKAELDALR